MVPEPKWHLDHICFQVQRTVTNPERGPIVVNLPPRKLKSFVLSVCLHAWLLGRDAAARIICASCSEDLAFKFSRDCRALMATRFYKEVFPQSPLNPKKAPTDVAAEARHRPRSHCAGAKTPLN